MRVDTAHRRCLAVYTVVLMDAAALAPYDFFSDKRPCDSRFTGWGS
jgi:hypothetical protein